MPSCRIIDPRGRRPMSRGSRTMDLLFSGRFKQRRAFFLLVGDLGRGQVCKSERCVVRRGLVLGFYGVRCESESWCSWIDVVWRQWKRIFAGFHVLYMFFCWLFVWLVIALAKHWIKDEFGIVLTTLKKLVSNKIKDIWCKENSLLQFNEKQSQFIKK